MTHTSASNHPKLDALAAGYTSKENGFHLPEKTLDPTGKLVWNPAIEWAGGGFISNTSDLACWAKLLYEEEAIEHPYLNDLLHSQPLDNENSKKFYGLGVTVEDRGEYGVRYGHGGSIPGYTSSMRYYPDYGVAIAFQINADSSMLENPAELFSALETSLETILLTK